MTLETSNMDSKIIPAPAWLTKEYLQDKLRSRYNKPQLIVDELIIKPASSKGDNYTSIMLRIKVSYRYEKSSDLLHESLIVKSTFSGNDNVAAGVMNAYGIYKREMVMYEKILPKLSALLESIGDHDKLFAKTIYVDYEHASIIFEDLSESDHAMADRLKRLDIEHAQLALRKLAKFHATAAVLNENSPEIFKKNFDRGLFNRHTREFQPMVMGLLDAMLRYIDTQPELKESYSRKVQSLRDHVMEYCERVFDVNPNHFMTLAHGDYWHTNMMFKYEKNGKEKQPKDVVPLDFQCSVWCSPTIDLQYFFNTSLCEELRLHQQLDLFQFYHNVLSETLKDLKYKGRIPSLFDLRIQWEIRGFYGLFAALFFQPVMICPETEDADFLNLFSNNESGIRFKDTIFKNVQVQKNLTRLLPIFDKMGLLDNMDAVRY